MATWVPAATCVWLVFKLCAANKTYLLTYLLMCLTGGGKCFKRRVLNVHSVGEFLTSIGSEFHSRMVAGKNDFV